jgi:hypothetical protein
MALAGEIVGNRDALGLGDIHRRHMKN